MQVRDRAKINSGFYASVRISGWLRKCIALLCVILGPVAAAPAAAPLGPTASELIPKVLEQARKPKGSVSRHELTRTKTTTYYDSAKTVVSKEERVYRTTWEAGKPKTRLILLNGQSPPAKPSKPTTASNTPRADPLSKDRRGGGESILAQLNEETAKRFVFSVVGNEQIAGRSNHVIEMKPRPGLKMDSIEEQVMAQLAGRIWVDEQDNEVTQADVGLRSPVKIGLGGMLGVLREFQLKLERTRIQDGVWINSHTDIWLHFRQLFTVKRIRQEEAISDVKLLVMPDR